MLKTGMAKVHKGETVIPKGEKMSNWSDAGSSLGKGQKVPKKAVKSIHTRTAKSGGYIHEHHHTHPEHHPMEEHTSANMAAMLQHMAQNMPPPTADPNAQTPDPSAAAAAQPEMAGAQAPAAM